MKDKYFDSKTGACQRPYGGKHSKELALQRWPIRSTTIWMDSMVALYWITNPGKGWKVFVANRVKKIAETTGPINVTWKYCSSDMKMERGKWFFGPEWLLEKKEWPQ